ncbi:hypothetical protein ILUMI_27185 [Ignelater luminosus]|uniref:Tyrosine-protein kinase Wsck n=1 Tax=Ignelater luminosus TaxID=2038154 RepID=A0A8K0C3A1_IGNLU|nr:hypothetical protein ILUMI_27185 [Ignelater luminosus]
MVLLIIFMIFGAANALVDDGYLGCYEDRPDAHLFKNSVSSTVNECKGICQRNFYRYALIRTKNNCWCTNFLGNVLSSTRSCAHVCDDCPSKENLSDVYATGVVLPGPPQDLKISNITNTSVFVSWREPESYVEIIAYEISAKVIHTFSRLSTSDFRFRFSNNTFSTQLNFLPCTKYNVSVLAISSHGKGNAVYQIIETLVGIPDYVPSTPTILKRSGKKMIVQLQSVMNNNGPTSAYQIAVVNEDMSQVLQTENLKSYSEAMDEGFAYYVTAEIPPQDIKRNFTIGDGRLYGGFVNAPLEPYAQYQVLLGIVSRHNNVSRIVWSNSTETHGEAAVNILPLPEPNEETPGLIIGLSVAIGLLSCLLIAGIIGFFILTRRVSNHRRRLTDNQELTMQGPIIEIENTGYVPEEEITPTNHYKNLKQQLWNIPQNLIKIEPTNSLGIGKFGRVNSGTLRKDKNFIPIAVYTISDKKLGVENKKAMLKELDILLRSKKHDNIQSLIGTCESPDTLFVILEYASMNLKDLLLGSRDALPGRFSNMQESQALDISVGVAKGMKHLESLQIVHKQLCARNILITNGFVPKISGYGLAQYCNRNMVPDYTRWTAAEVFRTQHYVSKCDVWSFAILLWEICVLGGTPYASVPNNEIPERVMRGLRLIQLRYISDDLYQLMLNCWQLDLDERPTFKDLVDALNVIIEDKLNVHLNFNLYPEFQYEQFYPDMELAARTVY